MAKLIFVDEDHNFNAIKRIADAVGPSDAVTLQQLQGVISPYPGGDGIDVVDGVFSVAVDPDGGLLNNSGATRDQLAVKKQQAGALRSDADGMYLLKKPAGHVGTDNSGAYVDVVSLTSDQTFIDAVADLVVDGATYTSGDGIDIDGTGKISVVGEDGSISVLSTGIAVNVGRGITKAPGVGDIEVNTGVGLGIENDKVRVLTEDGSISVGPAGIQVNTGKGIVKAPGVGDIGVNVGPGLAIGGVSGDEVVVKPEDGSISVGANGIQVNVGKGITKVPVLGDIEANVDNVSVKIVNDAIAVDQAWLVGQIETNAPVPDAGNGLTVINNELTVAVDPDGGLLNDSGATRAELAVKKQQAGALRSDANGMYLLKKPAGHVGTDNAGAFVDVTSLIGDPVFISGITGIVGATGVAKVTGTAPVTATNDGAGNVTVGLTVGDGLGTPLGALRVLASDGSISVTPTGINVNVAPNGGLAMAGQGPMVKAAPGGHILVDAAGVAVDVESLTGDPDFIEDIADIITGGPGGGNGIVDSPEFIQEIENIVVDTISISGTDPISVIDDAAGGYTLGLKSGAGLQVVPGSGNLEAKIDSSGGLTNLAGPDSDALSVRLRLGGGLETDGSGLAVTWTDVPPPTDADDAVNKGYVDAVVNGAVPIEAVQAASTGNVDLSVPVGPIDGVTLAEGDRVLLKDQTDPTENGIYVVQGGLLVRAPDASTEGDLGVGTTVFVEGGDTQSNASYGVSDNGPDESWTPGTDGVTWVKAGQITGYKEGPGINITGDTIEVDAGDGLGTPGGTLRILAADGSIAVTPTGIRTNVAPQGGLVMAGQGPMISLAPDSGLVVDSNNDLRVTGVTAGTPGDPNDPAIAPARVVKGQVTSTGAEGETLTFIHNLASTQVAVSVSVNGCDAVVDACRPNANTVSIYLDKAPAGTVFDIVVTG